MSTRTVMSWLVLLSILSSAAWSADSSAKRTCLGRVVDDASQPVAGAKVTLYLWVAGPSSGAPEQVTTQEQTTADDGSFSLIAETSRPAGGGRWQGLVMARKEGLAMAWENWSLKEDMATALTLKKAASTGGKVVDDTGKPIAGAEVWLARSSAADIRGQISIPDLRMVPAFGAKTDADGMFSLGSLPADVPMDFVASAPGRATVCTREAGSLAGQFLPGEAGIKIVLPAEAKIEGKVVDKATGKGVAGLTVRCDDTADKTLAGTRPVVSADDGTFSFNALEARTYDLTIGKPSKGMDQWFGQAASVTTEAGKTLSNAVIEVEAGGVLEAKVTDSDKKPVAKASVNVWPADGGRTFSATSNAQGIATARLAPGSYRARVYKSGLLESEEQTFEVASGKTVQLDIVMKSSPVVSGTVRDSAGKPVADATLSVFPMSSDRSSKSDSEGKFTVKWDPQRMGNPQTQFVLVARQTAQNLAAIVDIDADTKTMDIALSPAITFAGKVVGPNDVPLPGARVTVMLSTSNYSSQFDNKEVLTDSKGLYEYKAVPEGCKCYVQVSAGGYGQAGVQVESGDATDGKLQVETMTLRPATLRVSGVVVDVNDKPVPKAQVSVYGDGQPNMNVTTDMAGRFTTEKLCEGEVRMNAWVNGRYGDTIAQAGDTDVRVIISPEGVGRNTRSEPRKAVSLIGKPLPDISTLGLDPNTAKGKPMLLCFVDQNQRPSRHCLNELAAAYPGLTQKGFVVAAVQVGNTTVDAKPQFTIGRLADNEKARSVWGLEYLPWLVLTDGQHVIRAEGLATADIDGQIEKTRGSK